MNQLHFYPLDPTLMHAVSGCATVKKQTSLSLLFNLFFQYNLFFVDKL